MSRRGKLLLAGSVFLSVLFSIILIATQLGNYSEPSFDRQTLSQWLTIGSQGGTNYEQCQAWEAVRQIGEPATPFLELALKSPKHRFHTLVREIREGLAKIIGSPPNQLLRPPARDAEFHKGSFGFRALGQAGVPALRTLLKNFDPEVQKRAASCLGYIGSDAISAVPDLIDVLQSSKVPYMRAQAAEALGRIGSNKEITIALMSALGDSDGKVRMQAALALGRYDWVLNPFNQTAEVIFGTFRNTNALSCGHIDSSALLAIPELKKLLNDQNSSAKAAAIFALKQIKPE